MFSVLGFYVPIVIYYAIAKLTAEVFIEIATQPINVPRRNNNFEFDFPLSLRWPLKNLTLHLNLLPAVLLTRRYFE